MAAMLGLPAGPEQVSGPERWPHLAALRAHRNVCGHPMAQCGTKYADPLGLACVRIWADNDANGRGVSTWRHCMC